MDDQSSMRGQTFTLMVFGGLVVLCSVFFILGMVVGRRQSPPSVEPPAVAAAQPETEEPDLDFYEAVTRDEVSDLEAAEEEAPPPLPPELAATAVPDSTPARETPDPAVVLQLGAFSREETAEGVAADARQQGFSVFVSRAVDGSGLYRVQVGPFTSTEEASSVRSRLEDAGFDVIAVH